MSQSPSFLSGIHHVAYRCRDAGETVAWYKENRYCERINGVPIKVRNSKYSGTKAASLTASKDAKLSKAMLNVLAGLKRQSGARGRSDSVTGV